MLALVTMLSLPLVCRFPPKQGDLGGRRATSLVRRFEEAPAARSSEAYVSEPPTLSLALSGMDALYESHGAGQLAVRGP
jgi:hypothetical protein